MVKKLNRHRKKKSVKTELTWEEKNPTDYLYHSSKEIKWLRKKVEKETKA